jgi:hypothetical protein
VISDASVARLIIEDTQSIQNLCRVSPLGGPCAAHWCVLPSIISSCRSPCHRAEIRDFPRGLKGDEREELFELCLRGLGNCTSLRACTWTRDGSLNSDVLRRLQACETLRSLTINGQHHGRYDPNILTQFSRLCELSIIMPSPVVLHTLTRAEFGELESFSLICKAGLPAHPSADVRTYACAVRDDDKR